MNIKDQRQAIYAAESAIESTLDILRRESKLNTDSIIVQTILDDDTNEVPAIKVNIIVSRLKGK